jgi:competence protein ComEC
VPLIALAVISYAAGLLAGFGGGGPIVAASAAACAIVGLVARRITVAACCLLIATGAVVAVDAAARGATTPPPAFGARPESPGGPLERWRRRAGASIDTLFAEDAGVVRALLIADTRQLPADVRDRYARAGLVHVLSISGMHVAIISGAVLLALHAARVTTSLARWIAVLFTILYVAAIGAPPPAVRSAVMLGATAAGWALQRPVSSWATLALGALVPLILDPGVVTDLGYQLSVAGFAALTAASIWARRHLPRGWRGARRRVATDLCVSIMASAVTAPLVAWHFGRVSLIAPLTNLAAAPVVALMQPALFLALMLAPLGAPAVIAADGARILVRALDAIAAGGSAVPGASLVAAPSLAVAVLGGAVAVAVLGVASSRRNAGAFAVAGTLAFAAMVWWPVMPIRVQGLELHVIDVGQGDAIALRTPRGRWIVVDAGGGLLGGDAGRRIVVPYLRRLGGDVALFVMTHPHDDHVGGAAALITLLTPAVVRDAAFAGTSPSYREALLAARARGVTWLRIHPGDSTVIDGVAITFLAPDSVWTAGLDDPNLASAVMSVRFGGVRLLLTGDAEAPEEEWLLAHDAAALRADVLKVAHHGSKTGTRGNFLDAVSPSVALISVGARNRYGHPSRSVLDSLEVRGVAVGRTDRGGTIVLHTNADGTALFDGDRELPLRARNPTLRNK